MKQYRFKLEKYNGIKTRHTCPHCNTKHSFTKYIDILEEIIFPSYVGRCNKENKCGYHFPPRLYFNNHPTLKTKATQITTIKHIKKPTSFINKNIVSKTLDNYQQNNLYLYLKGLFGEYKTKCIISKYNIGTGKYWKGATIFWQIDSQGKIRTGKIMLYNAKTGRRVKEPYNHINWIHSLLKIKHYNLKQCFFGEHLVKDTEQTIGIVESEKTALIASGYYPNITWIATGGKNNCLKARLNKLQSNKIILFPDINAYDAWKIIANKCKRDSMNIMVSNYLETNASKTQREAGYDIADFLIKLKPRL